MYFMKLYESLSHHTVDTASMKAIRTGLNVDDDFWDKFMMVCNNPALAELLGVRIEQVMGWGTKVKQALKEVENADKRGNVKKTKLISTGEMK